MSDHGHQRVAAAVKMLLLNLPVNLRGWWMDHNVLHAVLQRGGIKSISVEDITRSLYLFRNTIFPLKDMYGKNNEIHYNFATEAGKLFNVAKDQFEAIRDGKSPQIPRPHQDYFLAANRSDTVKNAVDVLQRAGKVTANLPNATITARSPSSNTNDNVSEVAASPAAATLVTPPTQSTKNGGAAEEGATDDHAVELNQEEESFLGYKIVDIDMEHEFIKNLQLHAVRCGHCMEVKPEETKKYKKMGFDIKEYYFCNHCDETLTKCSGRKSPVKGKRGPAPCMMNVGFAEASFECGILPTKALSLFECCEIITPCRSGWAHRLKKVHEEALVFSEGKLADNRREHDVAMCRTEPGYGGDIKFSERSVARGAITADGGGPTRAYDHRITGTQHALIVFSCMTGKPIYEANDQISCVHCSRKLTDYIKLTGKKAQDILPGEILFEHKGPCYRNSKYTPAQAEEYAMERAGEFLLSLPDDEAIFAEIVVSDGDTRGCTKLISKQNEIIGPAADGQAIQLPDVGHFIKCISNGLYKLKKEDPTLSGVGLLEPTRIRAISGDVKRHLRSCHDELIILDLDNSEARTMVMDRCLQRVESIIPHHCGDHTSCELVNCKYLQYKEEIEQKYESSGEAVHPYVVEDETKVMYAAHGRFKGKELSLGKEGQKKVSRVLTKRLTSDNLERVAEMMSSNVCENFFGKLVKWTEGKRVYLGQANTYSCLLAFVAGMISDPDHGTHLLEKLGCNNTTVRAKAMAKRQRRFENNKKRKATEEYADRRCVHRVQTLHQLAKDSVSPAAHKSEKMAPSEGRSLKGSGQQTTPATSSHQNSRKRKCGNCGKEGHTSASCTAPTYHKKENQSKKKGKKAATRSGLTLDELVDMFSE